MNTDELNIMRIAKYLEQGEKSSGDLKIGLEYEHIITDKATGLSVDYFGEHGICKILEELGSYYDENVYIDGILAGCIRRGASVSIEPAAQFEFSFAPYADVSDILREYEKALAELNAILDKHGLTVNYTGYHPLSKIDSLSLTPKARYKYMYEHFDSTGKYGRNMMKGTAAVHLSIDYTDERDFAAKFKLAEILGVIFAFLTDNTPVFEGKKARRMMRTEIWDETDPARCGCVPSSFESGFGYEQYARYVYSRPSLYSLKGGVYSYTKKIPVSAVFADKAMQEDEIIHAMGMVFPYVRAKRYIEMRNADCMPPKYTAGYIALIKSIFYNKDNLSAYLRLFADFDKGAYEYTKNSLLKYGWDARICGTDVFSFAKKLISDAALYAGDDKEYLKPWIYLVENKTLLREGGTCEDA